MIKPTFYALILIDDSGVEQFAGAFQSRAAAESKGKATGKDYDVRAALL